MCTEAGEYQLLQESRWETDLNACSAIIFLPQLDVVHHRRHQILTPLGALGVSCGLTGMLCALNSAATAHLFSEEVSGKTGFLIGTEVALLWNEV